MATNNKKYLDEQGLSTVVGYIKERLETVSAMPASAGNGTVLLYTGATTSTDTKGHIYQYSTTTSSWTDITPSGGSGSGDMLTADYDSDLAVKTAGGIKRYVQSEISTQITSALIASY